MWRRRAGKKFMRNRRFESLRTVALWKQNLDRVYGDREPLDVGCGDGSFLRVATRCGWCAIGLDPDVNAVASCRSNALAVLHGGIELFDAMENRFDVITLNHVIEHVPDPVELLRSCYRLLKPGGQLWLQTPNIDSLGIRRYGRHWRGLEPPRHLVLFNPASLRLALHHARFQRFDRRFVPNPIAWIVKRSEEIRRGIPNDGSVKLSGAQRLFLTTARIRQSVSLSLNEALTVIAYKNGRFA